jgi:protein-S-isoprenylcysteine O-methyltransferase Ste14
MTGAFLVFLAAGGYGTVHSLLASQRVKNAVRKRWGAEADRYYRLFFNIVAVITFIPTLAVLGRNIGPVLAVVAWPWSAGLIVGQITSLLLMSACFLQSDPSYFLGLRQLGSAAADAQLITTGAYRIVRHPLYTLGLLVLWCLPIITTGTLAFNFGITLYILVGSELEERKLIGQFGDAYIRYRSKVARLIPFIY